MINHYGTIRRGHYAAFVKHYTSGLWFTMNDSRLVIMSFFAHKKRNIRVSTVINIGQ